MAVVETRLSDCYHNLIFDKFLQLRYQIPVKLILLLQMPKCKFSYQMSHKKVLTLVKMVNINYLCHNIPVQ